VRRDDHPPAVTPVGDVGESQHEARAVAHLERASSGNDRRRIAEHPDVDIIRRSLHERRSFRTEDHREHFLLREHAAVDVSDAPFRREHRRVFILLLRQESPYQAGLHFPQLGDGICHGESEHNRIE
jgi:hypothetical protein